MSEHHYTDTYVKSFQSFLNHTDEKKVLYEVLSEKFRSLGAQSVLDIGAGNGDLTLPLRKLVPVYEAVEQNAKHAARLREEGLKVYEGAFPDVSIDRTYDLVLLSHSTPWKQEQYTPFLRGAWERVAPQGTLLAVTYDGAKGEWLNLRDACGFSREAASLGRREAITDLLSKFGTVTTEIITTFVRTSKLEDMLQALAFVYSGGEQQKLERFLENQHAVEYLKRHNSDQNGYFFPFDHVLLQVR